MNHFTNSYLIVLYSHIHIHNTYTNVCGNIVNSNDNFNERTNTLLDKNIIPHTLFSKGWCFLCVRGELETGTDCYILTQSSSDHSSTSFSSWLGCSTVGHWGPKALCLPLALNSAYCPQLTPTPTDSNSNWNWPKPSVAPGYIIVSRLPASAIPPLIHTGASLDWRSRVNI